MKEQIPCHLQSIQLRVPASVCFHLAGQTSLATASGSPTHHSQPPPAKDRFSVTPFLQGPQSRRSFWKPHKAQSSSPSASGISFSSFSSCKWLWVRRYINAILHHHQEGRAWDKEPKLSMSRFKSRLLHLQAAKPHISNLTPGALVCSSEKWVHTPSLGEIALTGFGAPSRACSSDFTLTLWPPLGKHLLCAGPHAQQAIPLARSPNIYKALARQWAPHAPSALHILTHLTLPTTPGGGCYHYTHFTDENSGTELERGL